MKKQDLKNRMVIESREREWKPSLGEEYYIPDLGETCLYSTNIFMQEYYDWEYLHNGVMFKTREGAVECAKRMLDAIK